VAGSSVRFTLEDGEALVIPDDELRRVYEELWQLAPRPGAVSTAALVHAVLLQSEFTRPPIELTAPQSAVLREALARLGTEPA
jgi:hypothetical protein